MVTRRSLTSTFVVFVIFVCGALLGISGWRNWDARQVQLGEMNTATDNLSRAMAQQADETIHEADVALNGIVERVEHDGTDPAALQRLHGVMQNRVALLPQINGIFIYDERGKWLSNSEPVLFKQFNNADRAYFIYHRTHADMEAHIGAPIISRSTGQWVLPVSRRINHADGSFAGVVLATINLSYFTEFYNTLDIGQHGAIAMIFDDGTMAIRRPFVDGSIGKSMLNSELYRAFRHTGGAGNTEIRSSQDGVMRLNSYRPLKHYPLFVAAALSKQEVLADWRHSTVVNFGATALLTLLVGLFGGRLIMEVAKRVDAERETTLAYQHLAKANRALENLATHDGLTGLFNRHQFDLTLASELQKAIRRETPLVLIMLDLDRFKQYNDSYGHVMGDQCLRAVCDAIRATIVPRARDIAARYGGEEFVIVLPETGLDAGCAVAEHLRNTIFQLGIEHRGNEAGVVTVSAGVAVMMPHSALRTPDALIEAADQALYASKRSGRNRVSKPVSLTLLKNPEWQGA